MKRHLIPLGLFLVAALSATAQQRIEFQRQKFDRSRFERPDPSARPTVEPSAAEPAAEPVGNAWAPAPATTPAPMPTETPAPAPAPAPAASSVFSYSNAPAADSFATTTPAVAPTGTSIFAAGATLPSGPPPATYPPGATPEEKAAIDSPLFDQMPTKWFNSAKDYPELLELQKKTGACMLVYFKNPSVPNEKGLCSWFEKSITTDIDWRKAMKYFVKLEITIPGPSATRDLVAQFKVTRTPAIFVVKPGSTLLSRLMVFEYSEQTGGRPQPIDVPVVLESLKTRCTPAYQTLF